MNDRPQDGVIMKEGDRDGQGSAKGHAVFNEFIFDNKNHEKLPLLFMMGILLNKVSNVVDCN